MPYKKCYSQKIKDNKHRIHLWDDSGYQQLVWDNYAYIECSPSEATHVGLKDEPLKKIKNWDYHNTPNLHFHDMPVYQKFLIEKYGLNDEPSKTHKILFFDIEIEMGEALTEEYIKEAPKPITSIAWYDKQVEEWGILILDEKNQIKRFKKNNKEIIPCGTEKELLLKFLEKFREIDPDIIVSFNGDFFDIPYLYYRIQNVLGNEFTRYLSPIGIVREMNWNNQYIQIVGVESLDYLRLHKKYYWRDEPSYKLNFLGEKYVKLGKIEYEGSLDRLFKDDISKFIKYNFRDVEILIELDKYFEYIELTINVSHKGKHNYSEIYTNTRTQDGAISTYLLSENIIPPSKEKNPIIKKDYAGGYLFCPKAGLNKYLFDEDLVSLYPSIIITLNLGKETLMGRIIDSNDRNNHLALNDLKLLPPEEELIIENSKKQRTKIKVKNLLSFIEINKWSISANGVMFRTDKKSSYAAILEKWFKERVEYNKKKKISEINNDKEGVKKYHLLQYTYKILLNSTYGALARGGYRYGNVYLAEATTLTGQRIIQESAKFVNTHMNETLLKI